MRLEQVVPWGRSMSEYKDMFSLTTRNLELSILDCAGGPASFNAEMAAMGKKVICCDPIYQFSANEIESRITETAPKIVEGVQSNYDRFRWKNVTTIEELLDTRMSAMNLFLKDFTEGKKEGRYREESLPNLPFDRGAFDLVISSHLLFTYSDQLSLDFHLRSIEEMLRVAKEVRIFPLLVNMTGEVSPYVDKSIEHFENLGNIVAIQTVNYEFQIGGNKMLKISH